MSTRIYCDQCGTETSKRKALRFSLSGYSANRTSMGQLNDIEIDICPDCAQRFNDQTIGMIVTSMDGIEEHDRFICPVRPDKLSLYDIDPKVLRMHLDNGLLDTVMETEPEEFGYANVARNLYEWMQNEATEYELHPAGTNVDYDIDLLTNQLGPHLHPDWLRQLTNHRKLDLSTYRISDLALDHNPYQDHTGNHRVEDCIRRDRNDYTAYLDIMRAGHQGIQS